MTYQHHQQDLAMIPKTMVEVEDKVAIQTLKLLDKLEELMMFKKCIVM